MYLLVLYISSMYRMYVSRYVYRVQVVRTNKHGKFLSNLFVLCILRLINRPDEWKISTRGVAFLC